MRLREFHPGETGDKEFRVILAASLLFYTLLGLFFQRVNTEPRLLHPSLVIPPPRKITLQINVPREKPLPPPRALLKAPVKVSPRTAANPEAAPAPPLGPDALAKKNREIAQKKFNSLFGSVSDELIPDNGVNVISSPQGGPENPKRREPQGTGQAPPDLQIKTGDIDQLLNNAPGGDSGSKRKAVLGEHQTRSFSRAVGSGSGAGGRGGSSRSTEELEKSFKAYEGRLKSYYDRILVNRPDLKGIMVIRITLAADGHVLKCDIVSSDLNDKAFEGEISRIIQEQFKFAAISGKEEYYDRALNFHPVH
ncbi:MAG TPA: hypothetical protein VN944_09980 [Nitrospiria bacterium]|nr:hypothetical protein [Nitrospiria bacterium]